MNFPSILIVLVYCISAYFALEECDRDTAEWYKYSLGTKTPYRVIANTDASTPNFKGCKPLKIWMFVRHGTRNPGDDTIIKIRSRLPEIRDSILKHNSKPNELLRYSDLHNLATWKTDLLPADESILKPEGQFEALELAERMQVRFPELFPPTYSNSTYFFKHTKKQRTQATAKYFAAGLFGRGNVDKVHFPEPLPADPILEFYKLCEKWKVEVDKNPDTLYEIVRFENSSHMAKTVHKINKALNLKDESLSLDDIKIIYDACTFETAWNEVRKSPWCSIFNRESLKTMEFLEDLNYYYVDGYGTKLTYEQACPAFRDMYNFFKGYSNYPNTVAYFSHSGALLKMIAHLGLYKDKKPPQHSDYDNHKRKWIVSSIGPFATNLALVLYDCKGTHKVAAYHQERLVQLPACDKDLCSLHDIEKYYKKSINECDFEAMCSLNK